MKLCIFGLVNTIDTYLNLLCGVGEFIALYVCVLIKFAILNLSLIYVCLSENLKTSI